MQLIRFDYNNATDFLEPDVLQKPIKALEQAHKMLQDKTGPGNDYLGWVDLPDNYDRVEFDNILSTSQEIRCSSDILVVIGIGGSYLGARSAIEALNHNFFNRITKTERKAPEVYYAGNNISSSYLSDLLELLDNKDVSLNVISKSGTTTEPAIAFRVLKEYMEKRYGRQKAAKRIYATTDKNRGALKKLAEEEGYTSFVIPDNVGGRYSVLTAVGLLPIAVSGVDIEKVMQGAAAAYEAYKNFDPEQNECYKYAVIRNALYNKGKNIEIMVNYEPSMHYMTEWWKQLFGESEGKEGKGIFPAGVDFTTDLHSMGQYIQDGCRNLFETVLNIEKTAREMVIKENAGNIDGLNYLAGKTVDYVNKKAMEGTIMAHVEGGVPNLAINIPKMSPFYYGNLVYFFEKACGISGYMLGVNPFDQPGVEAYKKNMFRLLGKP